MKILKTTIRKKWFKDIATGIKTEEYREIKPYWTERLTKHYDAIQFRNGYRLDSPTMLLEYHGYSVKKILHPVTKKRISVYALKLGRILELKNYGKV